MHWGSGCWFRGAATLGLILGAAAPAFAQGKDDPHATASAEQHFTTGKRLHDAGDFDGAIREFLAAYALTPHSGLLFNIARSYEKKGDLAQALDYYQKVLLVETDGDLARWTRERIAVVFQRQAAERNAGQGTAKPDERPPRRDPPPSLPPRDRQDRAWTIAGVAVGSAGLVAGGLGIKFALDASDHSSALRSATPRTTDEYNRIVSDGRRAERAMYVLYGVGGALAIAGAILLYRGLTIEPEASPEGASVTVGGTF
ncbi:MAG: tol-pal system YbgF family protein [Kofleriaceae bacterium]